MPANGCASTCVFQSSLPVLASTAYAFVRVSPKNTAVPVLPFALYGPTESAPRTPNSALYVQYVQPVFGLSASTYRFSLAANRRPPATIGCARAEATFA